MVGKIKKIDLLMPSRSQYEVLHHFTRKFAEAFIRAGYTCRLLDGEDCLYIPLADPPDLTLCFNGAIKGGQEAYLCDLLKIPHVSCLIDPPFHFFELTNSDLMILTCDDRFCTQTLQALNFPRALFLPHAVERDLVSSYEEHQRNCDVVMLGSFIDFEGRRLAWKKLFPERICHAMDLACEQTLNDETTSFILALQQVLHPLLWKEKAPYTLNANQVRRIFTEVELYIKGKDRVELISAIKDAKVHIFGATVDFLNWKDYFRDSSNIITHPAVNYSEALDIMKKSKIVLNSSVKNKEGAHERIFTGLACGALVVTNDNSYISQQFEAHEGLILFQKAKLTELNDQINFYLAHEDIRQAEVKKGIQKVLQYHTWDQRVKELMTSIEPIVEQMKRN